MDGYVFSAIDIIALSGKEGMFFPCVVHNSLLFNQELHFGSFGIFGKIPTQEKYILMQI